MRIICGNCGDTIEEVGDDYDLRWYEYFDVKEDSERVVVHTGTRCCGGSG